MKWKWMTVLLLGMGSAAWAADPTVMALPNGGKVPDAEVDDQGRVHVAYLADNDVFYIRSDDGGTSFSDPIRVNTEAGFASGGGFRGPDLAVDAEGAVHVVWYNAGFQQKRPKNQWGVMYSRLQNGAKAFEKSRNLNQRPSDGYSLAVDSKKNVSVVWLAEKLYVQQSRDGGTTFSRPIQLLADPCECCATHARYDSSGNLRILYREKASNKRDMHLSVVRSGKVIARTKLGPGTWQINACPMTGGSLSLRKDGMLATWEQRGAVYVGEVSSKTRAPVEPILLTKQGKWPASVETKTGASLVVWKEGTSLAWAEVNKKDSFKVQIKKRGGVSPDRPAIVANKQGDVLVFP